MYFWYKHSESVSLLLQSFAVFKPFKGNIYLMFLVSQSKYNLKHLENAYPLVMLKSCSGVVSMLAGSSNVLDLCALNLIGSKNVISFSLTPQYPDHYGKRFPKHIAQDPFAD